MKAKISIITLGVEDLDRATRFYRDGLQLPQHQFDGEGICFFALSGTWLALYPKQGLADDIGISIDSLQGGNSFTLAHNVASPEEVDAVLHQAMSAGATLLKPAAKVFWGGYSGYFSDPDGYFWEVAYNPFEDLT
jgi:hypothetical protein